jgi:hypothetical protein
MQLFRLIRAKLAEADVLLLRSSIQTTMRMKDCLAAVAVGEEASAKPEALVFELSLKRMTTKS